MENGLFLLSPNEPRNDDDDDDDNEDDEDDEDDDDDDEVFLLKSPSAMYIAPQRTLETKLDLD